MAFLNGGDKDAMLEHAREIAKLVQLDGDVIDFPAGYDTSLGERGVTLSGGAAATHCHGTGDYSRPEHPHSR